MELADNNLILHMGILTKPLNQVITNKKHHQCTRHEMLLTYHETKALSSLSMSKSWSVVSISKQDLMRNCNQHCLAERSSYNTKTVQQLSKSSPQGKLRYQTCDTSYYSNAIEVNEPTCYNKATVQSTCKHCYKILEIQQHWDLTEHVHKLVTSTFSLPCHHAQAKIEPNVHHNPAPSKKMQENMS